MKLLYGKILVLILLAMSIVLVFLSIVQSTPIPQIKETYGETQVQITSDTAWILSPQDCANITWNLEGIQGVYINDNGQIGQGTYEYCPAEDTNSPQFDIIDGQGVHRYISLNVYYVMDFISYLLGFIGIGFTVVFTIYMLVIVRPDKPFPIIESFILVAGLAIVGFVLRVNAPTPKTIDITSDSVSLHFQAEHDHIIFPDECVTIRWSVSGAENIKVNGSDVTSEENPAQSDHCAQDGNLATLQITDANGATSTHTLPIPSLFPYLDNTTIFAILSLIGIILSASVYIPILIGKIRQMVTTKQTDDGLIILAMFACVLLIYLPFGFNHIGQWEEWVITSYIEGKSANLIASEMVSRYWVIVPHTLAYIISSESFFGYHLINFGMFFGKMILLFSILRQLKFSYSFAFIVSIVFMFYPVNSALMSLRSFPMQFSALTLLAAIYLILDYRRHPTRLKLLGIWWSLAFNIFSNESAYVIILVVPLLWYLQDRKLSWRNFNLTAIWYLYPAYKVALLIFLSNTNRTFYQSGLLNASSDVTPNLLGIFQTAVGNVYRVSFIDGWQNAFSSLDNLNYIPVVIVLLAIIISTLWWISRETSNDKIKQHFVTLIAGFLLIPPAVGILIWIPLYRGDLWRMYFYVPIAAALVLTSIIFIITNPIKNKMLKTGIISIVMVALLLPASNRLMTQHQQYVNSAQSKATILFDLINIAPNVVSDSHILLRTDFSARDLQDLGIFELIRRDMFNSALYLLYGEHRPEFAYFCLNTNQCSTLDEEETLFNTKRASELQLNTIVFSLNRDMTVTLEDDPGNVFDFDWHVDYDVNKLINASNELPSRVMTMLSKRN